MKNTHIRLDAGCNSNWDGEDAPPVAILNLETTTHDRLAYCFGLVCQIEELTSLLLKSSADTPQSCIGTLLQHNVDPLMKMLHELASSAHPNKLGASHE